MKTQDAKIGIFDSGLGGLTVLKNLKKKYPSESFIYIGDLAYLPYGNKSKHVIIERSKKIVEFFINQKVKSIIIACNSASSTALNILKKLYKIPINGVIYPSIQKAVKSTKTKSIGLIGTQATISSNAYVKELYNYSQSQGPNLIQIHSVACPLFVPIVEEGWEDTNIAHQIATKYLINFNNCNIDTLILGCTHYPMLINTLKNVFKAFGYKKLNYIDSGDLIINLSPASASQTTTDEFYITDTCHTFNELANKFLGYKIPRIQSLSL